MFTLKHIAWNDPTKIFRPVVVASVDDVPVKQRNVSASDFCPCLLCRVVQIAGVYDNLWPGKFLYHYVNLCSFLPASNPLLPKIHLQARNFQTLTNLETHTERLSRKDTMTSRLQILSATYRTLDITTLVCNEVRGKTPYGTIKIEPWNIIPWASRKLLDAPPPEVVVIAWRIALAGGLYTVPRITTGKPTEQLEIKFDDDLFKQSDHAEDISESLSLVNATYFDCTLGFKDVTRIVHAMFTASKIGPVAIPVTDSTFDGSAIHPDSNCKNQLTVVYWHKAADGEMRCKGVSGSTGNTLCIERDGEGTESTTTSSEVLMPVVASPAKVVDNKMIISTIRDIPEVVAAIAA